MSVRIIKADVASGLRQLPDDSVHCVVTSPPYFGLRSYLPDDHPMKRFEIGSEPTVQEHIEPSRWRSRSARNSKPCCRTAMPGVIGVAACVDREGSV